MANLSPAERLEILRRVRRSITIHEGLLECHGRCDGDEPLPDTPLLMVAPIGDLWTMDSIVENLDEVIAALEMEEHTRKIAASNHRAEPRHALEFYAARGFDVLGNPIILAQDYQLPGYVKVRAVEESLQGEYARTPVP